MKAGPVRWIGSKSRTAAKIVPLIPWSKIYVEPYGGAGSIMCNLSPRPVEVYNDLNGELVNLFRVLQDEALLAQLERRLQSTLYSFDEFKLALTISVETHEPVEAAWAFFVRQNQGFSGIAKTEGHWGRAFVSTNGMAMTCSAWNSRIRRLQFWHERFMRVQIDHHDALDVIAQWDSPDTTFYCDPPYMLDTRQEGCCSMYRHEMTLEDHRALIDALLAVKGNVVLSGYAHPLYDRLTDAGWATREFPASYILKNVNGALSTPRTEKVWIRDTTTPQSQLALW